MSVLEEFTTGDVGRAIALLSDDERIAIDESQPAALKFLQEHS